MSESTSAAHVRSDESQAPMGRRTLLVGAGLAAVAAGAGVAWWRHGGGGGGATAQGGGEEVPMLWALQCTTPAGAPFAMQSLKGRPLLVNFWATWCPPCIEELPLVDAFFKDHSAKGWQVIGLAIDQAAAVQTYLQKMPVSFPIGVVGMSGTELLRSLGNGAGGLPFSVAMGADGTLLHRKMGKLSPEDLASWAA